MANDPLGVRNRAGHNVIAGTRERFWVSVAEIAYGHGWHQSCRDPTWPKNTCSLASERLPPIQRVSFVILLAPRRHPLPVSSEVCRHGCPIADAAVLYAVLSHLETVLPTNAGSDVPVNKIKHLE